MEAASIDCRLERIAAIARALTSEQMTRSKARRLSREARELIASCDTTAVQRGVQLEAAVASGAASSDPASLAGGQHADDRYAVRSTHDNIDRMKSIARALLSEQMTCAKLTRLVVEGRGLGASCRSTMPGVQRGPVVIEQHMMPR